MHPAIYAIIIFLTMIGKFTLDVSNFNTYLSTSAASEYMIAESPYLMNIVIKEYPWLLKYSLEYAMKEVGEEGNIIPFSSLMSKLEEKTKQNIRSHNYRFPSMNRLSIIDISYNPDSIKILLGVYSNLKGESEVKVQGRIKKGLKERNVIEIKRIALENVSSPVRFQLLYDKTRMFYELALKGNAIACLRWDGINKVKLSLKALVQGGFESYLKVGDTKRDCNLKSASSCTLTLSKVPKIFTVKWKPCEECDEEETLLEKGVPYESCINYNRIKTLPEIIDETINNDEVNFPRRIEGRESCSNRNGPSSGSEALARYYGTSLGNINSVIKSRLKNIIQNIVNQISDEETENGIDFDINVKITSASYSIENSATCSWKECCSDCSVHDTRDCYCPPPPEEETGENGGSSSLSLYSSYTLFYPLSDFKTESVKWKFYKSYSGSAPTSYNVRDICPSDEPCNCDCECGEHSCSEGCTETGTCYTTDCDYPTLKGWSYTYSYSYSYQLEIVIKDVANKILIAE